MLDHLYISDVNVVNDVYQIPSVYCPLNSSLFQNQRPAYQRPTRQVLEGLFSSFFLFGLAAEVL